MRAKLILFLMMVLTFSVPAFAQDGSAILTETVSIQAHTEALKVVEWSPDGTQILTAGRYDKLVRVWDASTGEEVWSVEYSASIQDASWSPDGTLIAVARWTKLLFLDAVTGEEIEQLDMGDTSQLARWSPDGTKILLRISGEEHQFQVWDVESASISGTLPATNILTKVTWSADSKTIVTYDVWERVITVLDVENGDVVWHYEPAERIAETADFSPESNMVVVAHAGPAMITDSSVEVWDVATEDMLWHVDELPSRVMSVGWSPDGQFVAGAGMARVIWLFDGATGEELQVIEAQHEDAITFVKWSPASTQLATADNLGVLKIWTWAE